VSLSPRAALAASVALLAGLIATGAGVYYELEVFHTVPLSYDTYFRLALTAALGLAAILLVQRILLRFLEHHIGPRRGGLIFTTYQLGAYTLLVVALLLTAGVNSFAILAGGTFAGLVLGLAGQVALSNIIAGIVLLFVRPMYPGERVTLVSPSYGLLMPSYPPKFYSQDFLVPGYTGVVRQLGLVYSYLRLDDGPEMRIPNNVLIQAAILSHDLPDRWVRVKYEVPGTVEAQPLLDRLTEQLARNTWVVQPDQLHVYVNQATMASYVIAVDARCRGNLEEPPRSALLVEIMTVVRELTASAGKSSRSGG
jgi:small conductance mechanosensitive channel